MKGKEGGDAHRARDAAAIARRSCRRRRSEGRGLGLPTLRGAAGGWGWGCGEAACVGGLILVGLVVGGG